MKIRNSLPVVAAVLALGTSAAFATTIPYKVTGDYTIGNLTDGTTVDYELGSGSKHAFSASSTLGKQTTESDFFQTNPPGSCSRTNCPGGLLTDTLTITFTDLNVTLNNKTIGGISSLALSGTFTAQYDGNELGCAKGDSESPTGRDVDTDCFVWQQKNAVNTNNGDYNGYSEFVESLGNSGYDLDIYLYNAADWDIKPMISFGLTYIPPTTPEPATLALFAAGLAALGWSLSRRRKLS